jgi:hypothetical protein
MNTKFGPIFLCQLLSAAILLGGNEFRESGARSQALGGASLTFTDVYAIHNNQAGIAFLEDITAGIYSENRFLVEGINQYAGAFALPGLSGVFGLAINFFGFKAYNEKKIGLAYARNFGDRFSAGIQFDFLSTTIMGYGTRNNFTAEAGLLFEVMPGLWMGTHIYNPIRSTLSDEFKEDIPVTISFGGAYHFSEQLILTAEMEKNIDETPSFQAGIEYAIIEVLDLRVGISTAPSCLSFGIGLHLRKLQIDLAGNFHQVLGLSPSAGIAYTFQK